MEDMNFDSTPSNMLDSVLRTFSTGPRRLKRAARIDESLPSGKSGGSSSIDEATGAHRYDALVDEDFDPEKLRLMKEAVQRFDLKREIIFRGAQQHDPAPPNTGLLFANTTHETVNTVQEFKPFGRYLQRRPIYELIIDCELTQSNYRCCGFECDDSNRRRLCFCKTGKLNFELPQRIVILFSRDFYQTGLSYDQREYFKQNYVQSGELPVTRWIKVCLEIYLQIRDHHDSFPLSEDDNNERLRFVRDRLRELSVL